MSEETLTSSSEQAAGLVPLEWLESQICELAGHLTATTAQFLTLLGDFDARSGWAEWDLPSCAAWLSWKCQLTSGTAREHVRVARALRTLPVISAEFAAGRMSFAKVRALTRIATPVTEAGLAELAGPMTASQLERFVRAHRQVSRANAEDAITARRLTWREEDDGSLSVSIKLPAADGAVVLQALRAAAGDLEHPHDKEASDEAPPAAAGLADALVEIAGGYLAGKIATADNPDIYQVIVHADATVLAEPPASPEAAGVSAETPAGSAGSAAGSAGVMASVPTCTMTWYTSGLSAAAILPARNSSAITSSASARPDDVSIRGPPTGGVSAETSGGPASFGCSTPPGGSCGHPGPLIGSSGCSGSYGYSGSCGCSRSPTAARSALSRTAPCRGGSRKVPVREPSSSWRQVRRRWILAAASSAGLCWRCARANRSSWLAVIGVAISTRPCSLAGVAILVSARTLA